MRKRILAALCVLVIFSVLVFSVPVSAAQPNTGMFWNWEDFVSDSSIVGDSRVTTVTFPNTANQPPYPTWIRRKYDYTSLNDFSTVDASDMSLKITWPLDDSTDNPLYDGVRIKYFPFGEVAQYLWNPGMYVENIPNGTNLSFVISITFGLGQIAELFANDINLKVTYFNFETQTSVKNLGSQTFSFDIDNAIYETYMVTLPFSFDLQKPENCNTISVEVDLGVLKYYPSEGSNILTISPSPMSMTFENSVMAELLDKIDSGNQTMDKIYDVITQPADPVTPSGAGHVDDYHQQEEQLMQGVSGGQSQVGDVQNNAAAGLTTYASGFAFMAATVNYFVDGIPFISDLVWISLSLGTVAALLGIAMSAFRGRGDSADRSSGSTSKKE